MNPNQLYSESGWKLVNLIQELPLTHPCIQLLRTEIEAIVSDDPTDPRWHRYRTPTTDDGTLAYLYRFDIVARSVHLTLGETDEHEDLVEAAKNCIQASDALRKENHHNRLRKMLKERNLGLSDRNIEEVILKQENREAEAKPAAREHLEQFRRKFDIFAKKAAEMREREGL